jgi:hypothetical protein
MEFHMVTPPPAADRTAEDQYRRMMRSFQKLAEIASDHPLIARFGYQADDAARDFFTDAYHLKDYLKKHPGIDRAAVEAHVTASRALSIAGDIANTLKHGGLDRPPRSGAPLIAINTATVAVVPMAAGDVKLDFGGRNPRDGDTLRLDRTPGRAGFGYTTVVITVGSEKFQGYDLALKCIADWRNFFAAHGLSFRVTE